MNILPNIFFTLEFSFFFFLVNYSFKAPTMLTNSYEDTGCMNVITCYLKALASICASVCQTLYHRANVGLVVGILLTCDSVSKEQHGLSFSEWSEVHLTF